MQQRSPNDGNKWVVLFEGTNTTAEFTSHQLTKNLNYGCGDQQHGTSARSGVGHAAGRGHGSNNEVRGRQGARGRQTGGGGRHTGGRGRQAGGGRGGRQGRRGRVRGPDPLSLAAAEARGDIVDNNSSFASVTSAVPEGDFINPFTVQKPRTRALQRGITVQLRRSGMKGIISEAIGNNRYRVDFGSKAGFQECHTNQLRRIDDKPDGENEPNADDCSDLEEGESSSDDVESGPDAAEEEQENSRTSTTDLINENESSTSSEVVVGSSSSRSILNQSIDLAINSRSTREQQLEDLSFEQVRTQMDFALLDDSTNDEDHDGDVILGGNSDDESSSAESDGPRPDSEFVFLYD